MFPYTDTVIIMAFLGLYLSEAKPCEQFLNENVVINIAKAAKVYYGNDVEVVHKGITKLERMHLDSLQNLVVEHPAEFLDNTFRWNGTIAKIQVCRGAYQVCYNISKEEVKDKNRTCSTSATSSARSDFTVSTTSLLKISVPLCFIGFISYVQHERRAFQ